MTKRHTIVLEWAMHSMNEGYRTHFARGTIRSRGSTSVRVLDNTGTRTLAELAAIIRSKNAGPFRLTFDILFDEEPAFLAVAAQWDRTDTRPSRLRADRRGERG